MGQRIVVMKVSYWGKHFPLTLHLKHTILFFDCQIEKRDRDKLRDNRAT